MLQVYLRLSSTQPLTNDCLFCPVGNIGSGVLEACLRDPNVTSIVALSRRSLKVEDPKLRVIIHEDFSSYTDEILDEALSCDGAIW